MNQAVTSCLLCVHACVLHLQALGEDMYTGFKFLARQQGPKHHSYQQLRAEIEAANKHPDSAQATRDYLLSDPRRNMMEDIAARAASK
jgi:hypothetical protein